MKLQIFYNSVNKITFIIMLTFSLCDIAVQYHIEI